MSLVQTERVLVVPTKLFHGLGYFQGFSPNTEQYLEELLSPEHTSYRARGDMEQDPEFKQLIPYVIFCHTDSQQQRHLFCYTRGKGQGEHRLHAKRSLGIGGHISSIDSEVAGAVHPYDEGMRRELEEEVIIETTYRERCVGLINDDSTDVGKVHLGIVHLFDVEFPAVRQRESDILDAGFVPLKEVQNNLERFETWSQISVEFLFT